MEVLGGITLTLYSGFVTWPGLVVDFPSFKGRSGSVWDDAPVINAFASAAPAGVRDHAHLPEYIRRVLLRDGERRPEPAAQAMADYPTGASHVV